MAASGCLPACPIVGQWPQSLEISQWLPQAVFLHAPLRASVHNHSRSVNGCLRLSPCMPHWGSVATIIRDQSMVASDCLPACPIEGQCPQSLEISQWLPQAVSLHAPLRASGHNHSRSVNGCLWLSPCMPHCGPVFIITQYQSMAASGCLPACPIQEWALLMHMFEVQSREIDSWTLPTHGGTLWLVYLGDDEWC